MIGRRWGGGGMHRRHGRGGGHGFGLILLAMQVMRVGLDNIPPVTLATLAANTAIFLRILKVPSIKTVCVSAVKVWYENDWTRLLLAPWFHSSDMHLYFNMVSFLWKGKSLEMRFGSKYFAYMIGVFCVLTSSLLVGLDMLAAELLDDPSYLYSCAVGFSAVIFAIKMVTTHYMPPGTQWIMGLVPVNSRIACWVELVVISLLVPNVSFTGHLAGILVGLAYVKGPLKNIMDIVMQPVGEVRRPRARRGGWTQRFVGGGTTGQRVQQPDMPVVNNDIGDTNNFDEVMFTGGLSEDEQLAHALHDSMQHTDTGMNHNQEPTPHQGLYPTLSNNVHDYEQPSAPPDPSAPPGPSAPPIEDNNGPPPYGFIDPPGPVHQSIYPDITGPPSQDPSRPVEPPGYHFVEQHRQPGVHSTSGIDQEELRRRRLARFDR